MAELRVKIVIDTDQLRRWATKHHDLGHQSAATVLTTAAHHYERFTTDDVADPPAPSYPVGLNHAELRNWTTWHIDHGPAGVAHILYGASTSPRNP